ncbi:hypothetical protein EZS27_011239 [termite gut metagenome]|uniref:Uncharacterized protein n=1 Tax=termite gut metagenome TaxID=433724 RepID=A0A5J4S479_9ZZZZ
MDYLQKATYEIEHPYPDNKCITCYKDFLRARDYLPYYQFNPTVFQSLVQLAVDSWNTPKRINRILLLDAIQKYDENHLSALDIQMRKNLFLLFTKLLEFPQYISNPLAELKRVKKQIESCT